jgi:hypothetical protein
MAAALFLPDWRGVYPGRCVGYMAGVQAGVEGITHAAAASQGAGTQYLPLTRHEEDADAACPNIPPADDTDPVGVTYSEP